MNEFQATELTRRIQTIFDESGWIARKSSRSTCIALRIALIAVVLGFSLVTLQPQVVVSEESQTAPQITQQKEIETTDEQGIAIRVNLVIPEGLTRSYRSLNAAVFVGQPEAEETRPYPAPHSYSVSVTFNPGEDLSQPISFDDRHHVGHHTPVLSPGDRIYFVGGGGQNVKEQWKVSSEEAYIVGEEKEQIVEVIAQRATPVEVRVIDETHGTPISGISVTHWTCGFSQEKAQHTHRFASTTSSDGIVLFSTIEKSVDLYFGEQLRPERPDQILAPVSKTIMLNKEGEQAFEVKIPTPIVLRVLQVDGTPAGYASLTFQNEPDSQPCSSSANRQESLFVFPPDQRPKLVRAERWMNSVPGPDGRVPALREMQIENAVYELNEPPQPGQAVVIQLQKACIVQARILDKSTQEPLKNGRVKFELHAPGTLDRRSRSGAYMLDSEGYAIMNNLVSGTTIHLKLGDDFEREIELKTPGEEIDLGDIYVEP